MTSLRKTLFTDRGAGGVEFFCQIETNSPLFFYFVIYLKCSPSCPLGRLGIYPTSLLACMPNGKKSAWVFVSERTGDELSVQVCKAKICGSFVGSNTTQQ